MPTLSYTHETMPKSSEEFQRQLAKATAASNPIDDLLELVTDLRCFEQKYEMASDLFYSRFQAGQMGDDLDIMEWASLYNMYSRVRRRIESALMRAAMELPLLEPVA